MSQYGKNQQARDMLEGMPRENRACHVRSQLYVGSSTPLLGDCNAAANGIQSSKHRHAKTGPAASVYLRWDPKKAEASLRKTLIAESTVLGLPGECSRHCSQDGAMGSIAGRRRATLPKGRSEHNRGAGRRSPTECDLTRGCACTAPERQDGRLHLRRLGQDRGDSRAAAQIVLDRHAIGLHDEHAPVAPIVRRTPPARA